MRTSVGELISQIFPASKAPAEHPVIHPRGTLAVCQAEGCQWRNFVHELTPATACRRHPGQTQSVPDGTSLRVRCFHGDCTQASVPVVYWRSMHTPENFRCPAHLMLD
jgi:hypothetical protein